MILYVQKLGVSLILFLFIFFIFDLNDFGGLTFNDVLDNGSLGREPILELRNEFI
jgi:hypothetical protein